MKIPKIENHAIVEVFPKIENHATIEVSIKVRFHCAKTVPQQEVTP